ncbi:MAG: CDP-diacylglycerol--glycerol-3-phosphate 3-phosphatidyltransferase [Clostridia bacterium]|nr:CDP-diacylglycerol--glycerol-3-phosphate 3-phosphatidyltransferase [Clostridia bacterium]
MNLPNKLTVSRAIATPLFMAVMLIEAIPFNYTAALIIFVLASLTDYFDGKIARSRGIITNFGKFLDPVADKMLTTAAMLGFMIIMPERAYAIQIAAITFLTLFREYVVFSVRLISATSEKKKVIAANIWGKLKTVSQMFCIILGLAAYSVRDFIPGGGAWFSGMLIAFIVTAWISAVFTVVSGVIYFLESKELIDFSE